MHEAILRDYYNNPNLNFTVYMTPFPVTAIESGVINAAAGTTSSILFAIAYMMVSNSLVQNIIAERRRNVKHQMIISGVSIPAYWMSHYIVDIAF
jgi:ATP-binding cassette subfamily A (ABC1) protein 1